MFDRATSWLLRTRAVEADQIRRARNVAFVAYGMSVLALLFVPVSVFDPHPTTTLTAIVIGLVAFAGAALAARLGRPSLGSVVLVGATALAIGFALVANPAQMNTPYYLILSILIAGATLRPRQIWWSLGGVLAMLWVLLLLPPRSFLATAQGWNTVFGTTLMLGVGALLIYLSASSAERALGSAAAANVALTLAQEALQDANRTLEVRVEERTAALQATVEQQRAQAEELHASLAVQERLSQTILELSLPIIPISDKVLIVPLVGHLDSHRAGQLLESVLAEIQHRRAQTLVLDVTGVAVVDTAVVRALLQVSDATRLLGGRTILVGIRPEVAQTLVSLGVDFRQMRTAASLQDGLALSQAL